METAFVIVLAETLGMVSVTPGMYYKRIETTGVLSDINITGLCENPQNSNVTTAYNHKAALTVSQSTA